MISNIILVSKQMMVTWKQMTAIAMDSYPKSGNRLLDFPVGEASLSSSEIKQ